MRLANLLGCFIAFIAVIAIVLKIFVILAVRPINDPICCLVIDPIEDAEVSKYETEGNWLEASEWLRKYADRGDTYSQFQLGEYYQRGKDVKQDWAEAYFWYRLGYKISAKRAGLKDGERQPGEDELWKSISIENHLTPDQIAAVDKRVNEWKASTTPAPEWRKLAEGGDTTAQSKLCFMHGLKKDVDPDYYRKIVTWCRNGAEMGDVPSEYVLAKFYESGKGGFSQSWEDVYFWYEVILTHAYSPTKTRDEAKKHLNAQQIKRVDEKVAQWKEKFCASGPSEKGRCRDGK